MAKAKKQNERTRESVKAAFERAKEKVEKGQTILSACKEEGIHFSTYYGHLKKEPKKSKVTPIRFEQLNINTGKTLIIITEDSKTVADIVAAFKN